MTAKSAKVVKFVVQLGVFANPDNAKQVEAKLKENNIHYYTEVLKSPAGSGAQYVRGRLTVGETQKKRALN